MLSIPRMHRFLFYLEAMDEAVHFMESEDRQDLLPEFLRSALSKDRFRGENMFELLPEFEVLKKWLPQNFDKSVRQGAPSVNL